MFSYFLKLTKKRFVDQHLIRELEPTKMAQKRRLAEQTQQLRIKPVSVAELIGARNALNLAER